MFRFPKNMTLVSHSLSQYLGVLTLDRFWLFASFEFQRLWGIVVKLIAGTAERSIEIYCAIRAINRSVEKYQ